MPYKDKDKEREYHKVYGRQYRIDNREKLRVKMKLYSRQPENIDRKKEYARKYRELNRDRINSTMREYRKEHPEYQLRAVESNRAWRREWMD